VERIQGTLDPNAARARVGTMLRQRLAFHEIESWLDHQSMSAERRDALWLVAWIETRRMAEQGSFRLRPRD
jgi:hypothetical protein